MKAVIRSDIYECPVQVNLIRERLQGHGIDPIFISSIAEMPALLNRLVHEGDKPFLYFDSPWEWVDFPDQIIRLHEDNMGFENTASEEKGDIFTYVPSRVHIHNDRLLNIKERFGQVFTFLVNVNKIVTRPEVQAPRIFITAHNRHQYLELTLNSLFASVKDSPITVLLNEPTDKVRTLVQRIDRPNTDFLEIQKNCFYSSINLAVQWYKPPVFVVCEDDFILPPTANELYPNWIYHFVQRLNHCDMVGWSPSTDNAPLYHRFPKDRNPIGEWTFGGKKFSTYPLLLGNFLAIKTDFWKEALRRKPNTWHTPLDNSLHYLATSYCTPSLKGYHIGWNQHLDGFGSLIDREFVPPMENMVTNIRTGESRIIRLDSIL